MLPTQTTLSSDFISSYIEYAATMPEVPMLYNKWAAVMAVAAVLGKSFYLRRGHYNVYPNLYVMLIGSPGTGKGVSCGILQSLLQSAEFRAFAADRSSKEKFVQDLADGFDFKKSATVAEGFEALDFGSVRPAECFILAEEFNDFIGTNNMEFVALLTKLWSYTGTYRNRLKTGRSVEIFEPCINLFGGNTHAGFAMAFPPEIGGQGFLARLLLVYGESTGKKVTFPKPPDPNVKEALAAELLKIKGTCEGELDATDEAREMLDRINQTWAGFKDDLRFQHYCSRRFTQLLKLCIIFAASRRTKILSVEDVTRANELLLDTEEVMQRALGEFGKAKHSDVNSKIMQALHESVIAGEMLETKDLWKLVSNDLDSVAELAKLLQNLQQADKLQYIKGKGWLPKIIPRKRNDSDKPPTGTTKH